MAQLWQAAFAKHRLSADDLGDIVDAHLGALERPRRDGVVAVLSRLARGAR